MKTLLFFLFFSISCFSQNLTEKWNSYLNRYEYYNSNSQLIGYKVYNSYTRTWEYYDTKQTQSQVVRQDENFELWANVLASKQQKYDSNRKQIQMTVDAIYKRIPELGYPNDFSNNVLEEFETNYIDKLNSSNYDLSDNNKATEIINWLYSGINSIIERKAKELKLKEKEKQNKINNALLGLNFLSGGYSTTNVEEAKYNPELKKFEKTKTDTSLTKVYLNIGRLYFYRKDNGGWRVYNWKYLDETPTAYHLVDLEFKTYIVIQKNMKFITFLQEKIGDIYTKCYTYKDIKKDETIKEPF